nr:UbiA family prenyltransferase [uncultured Rhodoferax sp.]
MMTHVSPKSAPLSAQISAHGSAPVTLVVDLDGSLIKTDLLVETANRFLIEHPFSFFKLLLWLAEGKSAMKSRLAKSARIDITSLPFNEELLTWLRVEKAHGRHIVLATASHRVLADQVAAHLDLFGEVFATDDTTNLKANAKRDVLVGRYGEHGFDYVGNDWSDVSVWQAAGKAHVVSSSPTLTEKARSLGNLGLFMSDGKPPLAVALFKSIRPHQWLKNLLVFIPLLAAHQYVHGVSVLQALLAFVVFCLTASSGYLLNDLLDVADDRYHVRKCTRPLASGELSLLHGWVAWPVLLLLAFMLTGALPWRFAASIGGYFALTFAYSLRLKQIPIVDVLTLAMLYTLRIIAGAAAIAVSVSFWLLLFSMFVFLSLAFIKRYSELRVARDAGKVGNLHGRGYDPQDLELVSSLGGSAGYAAVLVLALYIQDVHTASLYATPSFIWLACPLLLFWISRAWLIAHRGNMHDDPIIFALKDRLSWVIVALLGVVFVLAKFVS